MKKYLLILLFLLLGAKTYAQVGQKYYGATNVEAKLEFDAWLEIDHGGKLTLAQLKKETTHNEEIYNQVREQISHLIGHFSSESFKNEVGVPGVLGEKIDFTFKKIENEGKTKVLHYHASGKIVFHKDVFKNKKY